MRTRLLVLFVVLVIGFAFPVTAIAGSLTLHPSGFGEKSRANWKAGAGLPDSTGGANQALYMQKMVPTTTIAAGVVLIKGVEGQPLSSITGLSWDHRTDGHCGAGAPRWNIGVRDTGGNDSVIFLGCSAALHTIVSSQWCHDEQPGLPLSGAFTIRYLAILFDEGNDSATDPQPPPCTGTQGAGFVYLDNITVELNGQPQVWTSASDNGNQAYAPSFGPAVAYADDLVPTSDILALLQAVVPGVPLTSWVLYPDVEPADITVGLP